MFNKWIALLYEATRLGWEAQNVMMLRMMKLAIGGDPARREANRMVQEKIAATGEAAIAAASAAASASSHSTATRRFSGFIRSAFVQTSVGCHG